MEGSRMTKRAKQIANYLSSKSVYFYDSTTGLRLSREQLVSNINSGKFPKGHVRLTGNFDDLMKNVSHANSRLSK
jgi:hypothetical protein